MQCNTIILKFAAGKVIEQKFTNGTVPHLWYSVGTLEAQLMDTIIYIQLSMQIFKEFTENLLSANSYKSQMESLKQR